MARPTYVLPNLLNTFTTIKDQLVVALKNVRSPTTLGNDNQTPEQLERVVLRSHEENVENLYRAINNVLSDRDGLVTEPCRRMFPPNKFFQRIVGDGLNDSRARIFSILLFLDVDPRESLWRNFLDSLQLENADTTLPTFCDTCLPMLPDAIERYFGTEYRDMFDRAQHRYYPVDFESRFHMCLQELRSDIKSRLVKCTKLDENDARCPNESRNAFYPDPASCAFVKENKKSIMRLYIESFKAKQQFLEIRERVGDSAAYQKLYEARKSAEIFYKGVQSRSKAFAILLLMFVSHDSEAWLRFESDCMGSSCEFKDDHFPISRKNIEEVVGRELGQDYYEYQFRFYAPILHEKEQKIFEYKDRQLMLPISEKKRIGKGGSGKVYRVKVVRDHFYAARQSEYLAMKEMPITQISGNELSTLSIFQEQPLDHRAIMLPRVCLETTERIFIFSDLAYGNLDDYMKDRIAKGRMPSNFNEKMDHFDQMVDIAHALEYLHRRLVQKKWHTRMVCYHLDVKATNILVTEVGSSPRFKLTDFGISTTKIVPDGWKPGDKSSIIKYQPTLARLGDGNSNSPPEATVKGTVDSRADVWAFGTLLARFLVWLAEGYHGLAEFDENRQNDTDGPMKGQEFFRLRKRHDTKQPYLKESVQKFFENLVHQTSPGNGESERLLYESTWRMLQHKILMCDPDRREGMDKIYEDMRGILQSCLESGSHSVVSDAANSDQHEHSPEPTIEVASSGIKESGTSENLPPIRDILNDNFGRSGRHRRLSSNTSTQTALTAPLMTSKTQQMPSQSAEFPALTSARTDPQGSHTSPSKNLDPGRSKNRASQTMNNKVAKILSNKEGLVRTIQNKDTETFQRMLGQKTGNNISNRSDGHELLDQAVDGGNYEMARQLLEHGASKKSTLRRLLQTACMARTPEMIELIIKSGVEISDIGQALSKVCQQRPHNLHQILGCLLKYDQIDLEVRDSIGATPLIRVASYGDFVAVDLLVEKGAKLDAQDVDGCSPLHRAINFESANVEEFFIKGASALIPLKTNQGQTALHLCADFASENAFENARILLDAGADANAEDGAKETPLDLASRKSVIPQNIQMVELLCKAGARITDKIKKNPDCHKFEAIREKLKAPTKNRRI